MTRQRIQLTFAESFALTEYVRAHYVASKLADDDFAVQAMKALNFRITPNHIAGSRSILDLQANPGSHRRRKADCEALQALIVELEKRVAALEAVFQPHPTERIQP